MKQDVIEVTGQVTEALGGSRFRVVLDNNCEILCQISGKMRKFYIRVLPGDRVRVEMSPYDMQRGRIVGREKVPGQPTQAFRPGKKRK